MGEFNHKKIITKSNAIIKSSYSFSLLEQQILLYIVSMVNPFDKEFPLTHTIYVKDFLNKFPRKNSPKIYAEIENAIMNKFWDREIGFWDFSKQGYRKIRWLTDVFYSNGNGYFQIKFSPSTQEFLHQLNSNFTSYYIDSVNKFKSTFSIRIYEICICNINKSNKNNFIFIIELKTLREWLELEKNYPNFKDFKRRVLEKSKSEINTHSDLEIDFNEIKESRKVVAIQFIVERKQGADRATYANETDGDCRDKYKMEIKSHDSTNDDGHFIQGESGINNDDHLKGGRGDTKKSNPREESRSIKHNNHGLAEIVSDVGEENQYLITQMMRYGLQKNRVLNLIEDYGKTACERAVTKIKSEIQKGKMIHSTAAYLTACVASQYELVISSDEVKALDSADWFKSNKDKLLADAKKYIEDYEKNEKEF